MLTIDEAIKHCEEVAEQNEWFDKNCLESMQCSECAKEHRQLAEWLKELKALREQKSCEDKGEISDGYHTFDQLYHQRAILFATIVNQNKDKAWKSYKHSDGKYCFDSNREWFIVGVDTSEGSYTYHYSKEYWDYFDCKELDCGKEWDGHTEEDVTRLLSLEQEPCEDCISRQAAIEAMGEQPLNWTDTPEEIAEEQMWQAHIKALKELPSVTPQPKMGHWIDIMVGDMPAQACDQCNTFYPLAYTGGGHKYCPSCGSRMVEPQESDHKCHTCKHYISGENDGSCGSYICKEYSNWESEDKE